MFNQIHTSWKNHIRIEIVDSKNEKKNIVTSYGPYFYSTHFFVVAQAVT